MSEDDDRNRREARPREQFFDVGNAYVRLRMTFVRAIGLQPPDERFYTRRAER